MDLKIYFKNNCFSVNGCHFGALEDLLHWNHNLRLYFNFEEFHSVKNKNLFYIAGLFYNWRKGAVWSLWDWPTVVWHKLLGLYFTLKSWKCFELLTLPHLKQFYRWSPFINYPLRLYLKYGKLMVGWRDGTVIKYKMHTDVPSATL